MELNDEMMARATGGMGDTPPIELKFHIGDRVRMKEDPGHGEGTVIDIKYNEGDVNDQYSWVFVVSFDEWGTEEIVTWFRLERV
jgi:hypothetical protein